MCARVCAGGEMFRVSVVHLLCGGLLRAGLAAVEEIFSLHWEVMCAPSGHENVWLHPAKV